MVTAVVMEPGTVTGSAVGVCVGLTYVLGSDTVYFAGSMTVPVTVMGKGLDTGSDAGTVKGPDTDWVLVTVSEMVHVTVPTQEMASA